MHILFERAVPYVIGHLLKYYILTEKAFTLEQFNKRLHEFNHCDSQMVDRLQKISEEKYELTGEMKDDYQDLGSVQPKTGFF